MRTHASTWAWPLRTENAPDTSTCCALRVRDAPPPSLPLARAPGCCREVPTPPPCLTSRPTAVSWHGWREPALSPFYGIVERANAIIGHFRPVAGAAVLAKPRLAPPPLAKAEFAMRPGGRLSAQPGKMLHSARIPRHLYSMHSPAESRRSSEALLPVSSMIVFDLSSMIL